MCGIVGIVSKSPVNQALYDALLLLQHRGQDAAGISTGTGKTFHMYKRSRSTSTLRLASSWRTTAT